MTDTKRMVVVYLAEPDMYARHPTTGLQIWNADANEHKPLSELDFWMAYWGESLNDTDRDGKVCGQGVYPTLEAVVKLGGVRSEGNSWTQMDMTIEEVIHCLNQDKPQEGYGGD